MAILPKLMFQKSFYDEQERDEQQKTYQDFVNALIMHLVQTFVTPVNPDGGYNEHKEKGWYTCRGCGQELFSSDQKFDSHCGWPSFDGELGGGDRIKKVKDFSHGMIRTEIVCANCGGHLGHLFDDGPTESGQRYCVNSLSLGFKKDR